MEMGFFTDINERYFIIGAVKEENKRQGYKIYAANQKKVLGLVSKTEAFKAKKAGYNVIGLTGGSDTMREMINCYYNLNDLDFVNGKGAIIKSSGNYVLISYSGFAEDRKFRLINGRGYQRVVNLEEFEALIDEGKINGAKRAPRNVKYISIYGPCDCREDEFVETSV